jgi:ATP-dependent Clp protease ATP-binding subunit ClpX
LQPYGCGKTYLAQTLARSSTFLRIADATSLTEAGYVGEDVENILLRLIQAADFDTAGRARNHRHRRDRQDRAQVGQPSITRDVSGEGVQQAPEDPRGHGRQRSAAGRRKHPHQDFIQINTTNIQPSAAALRRPGEGRRAAPARDRARRAARRSSARRSETLKLLQPQDLLKYGFIPEFIGRLPIIVTLHHLDQQDIVRILTEPKNALVKQYQKFFSLDNVELVFQKGSLDAIAELALLRGTGARALKSIIEESLLNSMFEIPSRPEIKRCIISERSIRDALEPEFEVAEETEGPARAVGESA